ncbi:peptide/nickel transport system substrate-binding protein [Actinocorallia herbida]|uniref:Peptide/nickel transport system substrate-binding protein n=1 Tax=Actinocorallia herbida TaxID=58109 RepID=A0A3N1CU10_9ACTN|nr:ABC transporter substrate-binding protein [Actinocorallia herbida]ROO84793.1 peptide/nickel transport system substrate-binding protein [Actinocorallia herbida]
MILTRPVAAAALLAAALLLGGCGSPAEKTTETGGGAPVKGGSVVFAVDTEPVSFDAHVSSQDITGTILRNVFDSLVSQDAEGEFQPWLAESWEVSDDLKTYTFKLRKDVKFTDGTPFDAEAVKVNFDRIHDPKTKSQLAASLLGPYTGTEVVDASTAKVSFSAPFAPFLQAASTAYLGFYSPKTIKENGDKLGAGGPAAVGTGPFVFSAYAKGQSADFTRNDAYAWAPKGAANTGAPYLDKLTVRFLPESSVRVGALTSGQIQLAAAVPPQDVQGVTGNAKLALDTQEFPGGNYSLYLNTSKPPLNDEKVRKAVQQGVNVDAGVKSLYFGQYKRAWSPLSPATEGYTNKLENSWPYDEAAANKLLDEAGWTTKDGDGYRTKDGKRLTINWPLLPAAYVKDKRDILGQAFQADLKKLGIEVQRPQDDIGTYIANVYGGKADIADYSWARSEPDVLWLLFNGASDPRKGGQNATFLADKDLTSWTDEGRATLDPAKRADVYGKVQERAIELGLVIPVYTPTAVIGRAKAVNGVAYDANAWPLFQGAWLAK